MSKSVFESFTTKYALSKTLRFELKPVGRTREWMDKHLEYDKSLQTFLKDQKIENAYQTLKPVFDKIHENFINQSLESKFAVQIDFIEYLEKYRNKKELSDNELTDIEKFLRGKFEPIYHAQAEDFKRKAGKDEKGKEILKEKGFSVLTEKGILDYINNNIDTFTDIKPRTEIETALENFQGFFTYFGGFNQNRENYYETKKEASTAVATRIVNENLPKFCDNVITFESRMKEYLDVYGFLKNRGNVLQDKEGNPLYPIEQNIFNISYFNQCLSQNQIEEYNKIIGNANFLINLYNQANKKEIGFRKLSLFKTLYKQIGCGKRDALFFSLNFEKKNDYEKEDEHDIQSVEEVLKFAVLAGTTYFKGQNEATEIKTVIDFIEYIKNKESYLGIYWSKTALNTISNKYFANWHTLKDTLKDAKVFMKGKKGDEEEVNIPEAVELEGFFSVLDRAEDWKSEGVIFKRGIFEDQDKTGIIKLSESPSQALLALIFADIQDRADAFLRDSSSVLKLTEYKNNNKSKERIKSWMDDALAVNRMIKYFFVKESKAKGEPIDPIISEGLEVLLDSPNATWFRWYDALRNYLTKKPQDDVKANKLKLNFENSTLAGGWDVNKEMENYCVILRNKNGEKFLAVLTKDNKNLFERELTEGRGEKKIILQNKLYTKDDSGWQKMEYKLLPGPNKMLPKCLLPKSNRKKYGATEEILKIYNNGSFKKNEPGFSRENLRKIIDFYKSALQKYEDWQCFNFYFKKTSDYEDISQFYNDVEKQGYKLDFVDMSKIVIDEWVDKGKIYLFEIKNQDYNKNKVVGHKHNLHTIYWNAVFQDIANKPKLNGEAEVFYRKAVSEDKLEKIRDKNGKVIIKNHRFSQEKFVFHVPITLNFCQKSYKINDLINDQISHNTNTCFLGIDRGEKHLAYYSLVNQHGNIIDQGTLNIPFVDRNGKPRIVKAEKRTVGKDGKEEIKVVDCSDYNDLLEARSGDRDYARKNWQTIGTIKELKDGYISQVIRKIVDIATDQNRETPSFIVLENLNIGFKRGRQKIEKSVYQKLELALAKKLNFLVDKDVENGEVGSVTNALQLTPAVNNFGDIEGKNQFGVMLYTKADYTSQTDPTTGWRKSIYLKKGSEEYIKEQIINAFDDIGFDGQDYYFDYTVDYLDPVNKKSDKKYQKKWRLYSGKSGKSLDRFRSERDNDKNQWISTEQNIVRILNDIFAEFDPNRSLLLQIVEEGLNPKKIDTKYTGWESIRFAIDMIQQIRNTGVERMDADFILSPVRNQNGDHFDSRKVENNKPTSGDANGAYNIARKGIIMNTHIKRGLKLFIGDEEWDAWLAGKNIWEEWIVKNNYRLKREKQKSI